MGHRMSVIPFGRAQQAAPKAARGGGTAKPSPRVDFEQLEFLIRAERDKVAKANLFLDFLRAKGLTGEIEVNAVESYYWQLIDGDQHDEDTWNRIWLSMSRALGKICVKRQRRSGGERKQVLIIPERMQ